MNSKHTTTLYMRSTQYKTNKMHDSGYLKAAFVYFHTSISQMVFLLRETMFNFD
jgi:hypothetical protein